MRQERTLWPFKSTVHAPQTPCSQPTCVPVSPSVSRRKSDRRSRGSTPEMSCRVPLTVTDTFTVIAGSPFRRQRRPHRPIGQLAQQMFSIFGGAVQVAVRRDAGRYKFGEPLRCAAIDLDFTEPLLDVFEPQRRIGHAHDSDTRLLDSGPATFDRYRDARERKIAEAPGHFLEGPAVVLEHWKFNLHDDI